MAFICCPTLSNVVLPSLPPLRIDGSLLCMRKGLMGASVKYPFLLRASRRQAQGYDNSKSLKVSAEVRELTAPLTNVEGLSFALVVGRFNELVTKPLVAGALETFRRLGIKEDKIDVVWVPGSFEVPVVAQTLANTGNYHAILCIGAVIRGETTHYDAVANSAASGVMSAGLNSGVPCIFGILTCETTDQAFQRAGGKAGNKGAEAALTAIEMASLFQHHLTKLKKK